MIETGDCRDIMRRWIEQGVKAQMCVTSPPYWGLRDYGVAGQLGLESTPEEYVSNMVEVFRLVREVLAEDGTLWINLGDSYATGGIGRRDATNVGIRAGRTAPHVYTQRELADGLKPKDLIGIPWRVAFALQADGWYLRSDIIWAKPNPMPESVTDRPTKAHEYLFLLSKRERYYYDAEAIAESASGRASGKHTPDKSGNGVGFEIRGGFFKIGDVEWQTRNRRTVWTIATQPYSEAHFATFPEALVEPCVLAGTSARGHCPGCGKGWVRVVERLADDTDPILPKAAALRASGNGSNGTGKTTIGLSGQGSKEWAERGTKFNTVGWQPSCACGLDPVPGVVLDPFMGSGTVARVATSLGRRYIGCELNPAYQDLADTRSKVTMGLAL